MKLGTGRGRLTLVGVFGGCAVMVLAACSSGGGGHRASYPGPSRPASTASGALNVGTASGNAGTYLTGAGGRALYLWMGDHGTASSCSGACANAWPPLTAASAPAVSGSAVASKLGLVKRSDGTEQVTYGGHPLYYFAGDSAAGTTSGEGSDGFGARWWLVSPGGTALTGTSAGTGSSGGAGSSGGGGNGY